MTITGELIAKMESAYEAGFRTSDTEYAEDAAAHAAGYRKYHEAVRLACRGCSFADALTAAELYGRAAGISKANSLGYEYACEARFAMLIQWAVVPNRDEARLRASELMYDLGERFLGLGEKNLGAMQLTNGALSIVEMNNATQEKQKFAEDTLRRALRMRPPGSADYAYGLTNLAVIECQLVSSLPETERSKSYRNVLRKLNKAKKLFAKNNEKVPRSIYQHTVLDTLEHWLSHELSLARDIAYAEALPDGEEIDLMGLSKAEYVSGVNSNFASMGLDALPVWIPQPDYIAKVAISKIPMFGDRVGDVVKYLAAAKSPHPELRLKLYHLQRMAGIEGPFPYDSLDQIWVTMQSEVYLTWAIKCMNWQDLSRPYEDAQYRALVKRAGECVRTLKTTWSARDIERLLQRNPLSFRFIACELARLEEWQDAFSLLEASRGLMSSRTLNDDPGEYLTARDSISWMHITNSPMGTFVVCLRNGTFGGEKFKSLDGSKLSVMFSGICGGLLSSQLSSDGGAVATAAERIADAIAPVGDWIYENSSRDVVIMPGGYYQSFPVWSVGKLGGAVARGERYVSNSPSRSLAYKNSDERVQRDLPAPTIGIEEASSVPGFDVLPWSQHEPRVLTSIVGVQSQLVTNSATTSSVLISLSENFVTHFAGHSFADPDPYDSAITTYGHPVTVRDLLGAEVRSRLVVLGSCQSGLALNFRHQDEYLSIQSAIFYAGAELCIGTFWPVRDYVAFAFSIRLYSVMKSRDALKLDRDVQSVLESFAEVVGWMRRSTREEVNNLFDEYRVDRLRGASADSAFRFYDWAAFGIVGTSV